MEPTDILIMNCNLFKKMRELAERQEKVIFDDQIDEFNNLANQREGLSREITANSRRYESETKNIYHKRENQKAKALSTEISAIIRSIQETDKKIEKAIIAGKDALMNDIKNIKKGQKAVKSYGGGINRLNKFMDRNG